MRTIRLAMLVASCAVFLTAVGGVGAAPPDASPKRIVPGKAVGGVSIDQPFRKAKRAWGRGSCSLRPGSSTNAGGDPPPPGPTDSWNCVYTDKRFRGIARFETTGFVDETQTPQESRVSLIQLKAGLKSSDRGTVDAFQRPYSTFRTVQGIGLGSRETALRKAFPKLTRTEYREAGLQIRRATYLRVGDAAGASTIFGVSKKRVVEIIICTRC